MDKITRRDFLKLFTDGLLWLTGALGLAGLARFLSFELDPAPPSEYDLGPATNYPVNSTSMLLHIPAVLVHNEDGFYALSLVCSHLGCTVEQKEGGFECPCHGSLYSREGEVIKGPAKLALKRLRLTTTEEGNLLLHMN
jgi:cytochrome b6-f complex iron-sulfur subunit